MSEMRQLPNSFFETPINEGFEESKFQFELFSSANKAEVKEFLKRIFDYEEDAFLEKHLEKLITTDRSILPEEVGENYNEHYWVVRDAGKMVGVTGFNEIAGDEKDHCWLGWFAREPGEETRGLGAVMLDKVISDVEKDKKTLYVVSIDLPTMVGNGKFYQRNGFQKVVILDKITSNSKESGLSEDIVQAVRKENQILFEKYPDLHIFIWKKELGSSESAKEKEREPEKAL